MAVVTRSHRFVEHLYQEKEIHKEQRNRHLLQKLILSSSFFGLGQLVNVSSLLNLFLYIVPFIALIHDVYIFAEDFKVKRVGLFLRTFEGDTESPVCKEEIEWEKYVKRHREKWAYWGSSAYTILVTIFSAVAILMLNQNVLKHPFIFVYIVWLLLCVVGVAIVFKYARTLREKVIKIEKDEQLRD